MRLTPNPPFVDLIMSIDKVALVCKLLLDERVLALRKEKEALLLELFWKDHNIERLTDLMRHANGTGPQCGCAQCEYMGIARTPRAALDDPCRFDPWFRSHLDACGITVGTTPPEEAQPAAFHASHAYLVEDRTVYDVDAHFYQQEDFYFMFWKYGSRLWKATSAHDPELGKLRQLFQRLTESFTTTIMTHQ